MESGNSAERIYLDAALRCSMFGDCIINCTCYQDQKALGAGHLIFADINLTKKVKFCYDSLCELNSPL